MLNANLILEDVETLLHGHYAELQAQQQARVRVYETAPQPLAAAQAPPVAKSTKPLNELVANVFVLIMLSVLHQGLSNQPMR